ncbi:MAG: hypothetical protein HYU39_08760 [Thaumarchaeota archaeon]|nr:hypothetical protein [Nitrososphaerota archaeon]
MKSMRIRRQNASRAAISDLFASLITLVITVVTGAAVFSFVNMQASVSASSYGETVNSQIQQLREKIIISNVAFNYPSSGQVRIWFYNYGETDTQIMELYVGTSPTSLVNVTSAGFPLNLPRATLASITITYTVTAGQSYYFKGLAQWGNSHLYLQKA